jgi:hypothetical protein
LVSTFRGAESRDRDVDVQGFRVRVRVTINPGFDCGTGAGGGEGVSNGLESPASVVERGGALVKVDSRKGVDEDGLLFGDGLESCVSSGHGTIVS